MASPTPPPRSLPPLDRAWHRQPASRVADATSQAKPEPPPPPRAAGGVLLAVAARGRRVGRPAARPALWCLLRRAAAQFRRLRAPPPRRRLRPRRRQRPRVDRPEGALRPPTRRRGGRRRRRRRGGAAAAGAAAEAPAAQRSSPRFALGSRASASAPSRLWLAVERRRVAPTRRRAGALAARVPLAAVGRGVRREGERGDGVRCEAGSSPRSSRGGARAAVNPASYEEFLGAGAR